MILKIIKVPIISIFAITMIFALASCNLSGNQENTEIEQQELALYYVGGYDPDNGEDGDSYLIRYEKGSISYPTSPETFGSQEEMDSYKYNTSISMLNKIPEYMVSKEDKMGTEVRTVVTEEIGIKNIVCKDGIAYVDVKSENLQKSGGSTTEILYISQIVETLLNSFPEVEKVKFLVDGKESDTLMGHCDISEPFEEGLVEKIIVCV